MICFLLSVLCGISHKDTSVKRLDTALLKIILFVCSRPFTVYTNKEFKLPGCISSQSLYGLKKLKKKKEKENRTKFSQT